jgi:lysophospholipase L1-like esterase
MDNSPKKPSRWLIVWAGLSVFLPLLILYIYSFSHNSVKIGSLEIKQMPGNQDVDLFIAEIDKTKQNPPKLVTKVTKDSSRHLIDAPSINDTTKHRILLIGDSEIGGLRYSINDYCRENGHKIVLAVEWYSATTFNFGRSDTIDKIIAKHKPTYVFMVLGLNELYARDLKARKIAANQLAEKLKGIPYTWIGPANWVEDFGLNKVYESSAETGTYFMSKNLTLPRSKDGRHPDNKGYRIWFDSIASWVQTSAKYKIKMKVPAKRARPYLSPVITINAAKYRGY